MGHYYFYDEKDKYTSRIEPGDLIKITRYSYSSYEKNKVEGPWVVTKVCREENLKYGDCESIFCETLKGGEKKHLNLKSSNHDNKIIVIRNEQEYIFSDIKKRVAPEPKTLAINLTTSFLLFEKYIPYTHPIEGSLVYVYDQRDGYMKLYKFLEEKEIRDKKKNLIKRFKNVLGDGQDYNECDGIYWKYYQTRLQEPKL